MSTVLKINNQATDRNGNMFFSLLTFHQLELNPHQSQNHPSSEEPQPVSNTRMILDLMLASVLQPRFR